MAIESSDITALPTYTDEQLLKLYRWALANNAAGSERSINGRSVKFPTTDEMMKLIEWLEARVQIDADDGGTTALVQFRHPA